MIAAFFRPQKRAPEQVVPRPPSPPALERDRWLLVDNHSSSGIDASLPSLSDLDDTFARTVTHSPIHAASTSATTTPGLPAFWALEPASRDASGHATPQLVMPQPNCEASGTQAHVRAISPPPPTPVAVPSHFALHDLILPVSSAIAASCATVAYHAIGTVVAASYDIVPLAAVPAGVNFLTSQYPLASLLGTAAGSLWALQHLYRSATTAGNARANRTSMCISALTTSFWLFAKGPVALVGTAGSMALDLAQPAAQTYLLGALGLIYNADWLSSGEPALQAAGAPPLLLHPDDVAVFLAEAESAPPAARQPE